MTPLLYIIAIVVVTIVVIYYRRTVSPAAGDTEPVEDDATFSPCRNRNPESYSLKIIPFPEKDGDA